MPAAGEPLSAPAPRTAADSPLPLGLPGGSVVNTRTIAVWIVNGSP